MNDQSRLVPRASAVEALTQIRALATKADEAASRRGRVTPEWVRDVRAVLDAVPVDATLTEVIYECGVDGVSGSERLATAVTDVKIARRVADAVLALVRPVEGVVLSREEARLLVSTLRRTDEWHAVHLAALASRLEVS